MKRILPICLLMIFALGACTTTQKESETSDDHIGGEVTSEDTSTGGHSSNTSSDSQPITSLDSVTNIQINDGILTFTGVTDAVDYLVQIKQGEIVKFQQLILVTSLDLNSANLYGGNYLAVITARNGMIESAPASKEFKLLHVDKDERLEAEFALLDRDRNWSDDNNASNGAYGLAFDDCGQGMYFRYYAFEAGMRDVTITYSTGMPGSYMTLFANGNSFKVTYSENTNWFGDSHQSADTTVNDVSMVQGWNELYLIKNGTGSDNPAWGGYAQVDYITVEGTHQSYDLDEYDMVSYSYKLEAEMAHWHWSNSSQRPNNWGDNFSLGFGLGEMNTEGDGCKFTIDVQQTATYSIRPCIGGNGDGSKTLIVAIDGEDGITKNFGAPSSWNEPVVGDDVCRVELTAGLHNIDILRGGNWFTFDYLLLELISE